MKKLFLSAAVALGMTATVAPTTAHAQVDPLLGQMMTVAFNFCPRGWAKADGQLLPISSHTALFSLLGTIYGGDGRTTFALPDLRGRSSIHSGHGAGLNVVAQGERGGANSQVMTIATMPNHSHTATSVLHASSTAAGGSAPSGAALAGALSYTGARGGTIDVEMLAGSVTTTVNSQGAGQAFGINDPFLGMLTCISMEGVFPSRS